SWFFATAGFKFNIGEIAFAITGIAGIATMFFNQKNQWHHWSKFLFGIGFLFLGLDFMKTGMMELVQKIDLRDFSNYPAVIFLLIGLLITSLIQSSSATIVILLSALYANAISLYAATAMVLGSEIGTTLKFLLASVNGIAAQKRVAFGNLLFNVITSLLVLIFLQPVNYFITDIIGVKNNLLALAFFQTLINVIGIILFFPFLNLFAKFLEKLFTKTDGDTLFIHKVTSENTDLALDAFEKETKYFLYYVIDYSLGVFGINTTGNKQIMLSEKFRTNTLSGKYDFIKQLHGKLHAYYIELQNASSNKQETIKLDQLISAVRNSIYAAKSMKDGWQDAEMLRNSSNDSKYDFYRQTSKKVEIFYTKVSKVILPEADYFKELVNLFKEVEDGYTQTLNGLYRQDFMKKLSDMEISMLINFNRQIYTSFKAMVLAVKDYFLNEKEADYFDALPGFIH
ncbi:MAG TPA: Na/Pi symporter, partial [Chitinophagaceae bacterium]